MRGDFLDEGVTSWMRGDFLDHGVTSRMKGDFLLSYLIDHFSFLPMYICCVLATD